MKSWHDLCAKHAHHADPVIVYIQEAHAADEWAMEDINKDVCYRQPKTLAQRVAIAKDLVEKMGVSCPLVVDSMANEAMAAYDALPERLVVVKDGVVVFTGGRNPDIGAVDNFLEAQS